MADRLLIKHAIGGRTFADSAKQEIGYELERRGDGWRFAVRMPTGAAADADVQELLRLKNELNVFVFRTLDDGRAEKTWYYTGDGDISYDGSSRELTIEAGREIRYLPSDYLE